MKEQKIKVLVVDDTSFMRKALCDIISQDPDLEVIAVAKNGKEAVSLVEELKPDVITMDVDMPVMDGLTALKHIMIKNPTPIIMISGLASQGSVTLDALRLGAVDFFPKPSGTISLDMHTVGNKLTEVIKKAARISPYNIQRVCFTYSPKFCKIRQQPANRPPDGILIIIAHRYTSSLLLRLLGNLRPGLPISVIALHDIEKEVVDSYATEMNTVLQWKVFTEPPNTLYSGSCLLSSFTSIPCLEFKDDLFTVTEKCYKDDVYSFISDITNQGFKDFLCVIFGEPTEMTWEAIKSLNSKGIDLFYFNPEKDTNEEYLTIMQKMPSEQFVWAKVEIFGSSFLIDSRRAKGTEGG